MIPDEKIKKKQHVSLYWKVQFIGWGTVSIFWAYIAYFKTEFSFSITIINYILDVVICIGITHLYRTSIIKTNWFQLKLRKLILRLIPSVGLLAGLFMLLMNLKWHGFIKYSNDQYTVLWDSLLSWNPVFITGLRLMSIWVLAYHLYHYYRREITISEENAQLAVIAKQAQLDNLSSQLNPHFLFNSLNSVKSLIIENPEKARRAIDLLSDLLRSSLYERDQELIYLQDELSLVRDYIELEKLRFEERLNIKFDIAPGLNRYKILPLSIQLLVENAIKHGIDNSISGGTLEISIKDQGKNLLITIQNPGTLAKRINGENVGLTNLTRRLNLLYNNKASFDIQEQAGGIVTAKLVIPFQNE